MTPKQYILSREGLTHSYFARQIEFNKGQFSQWINGKGNIPKDKEQQLIELLKDYGYNA